jgi:hypothetical protein
MSSTHATQTGESAGAERRRSKRVAVAFQIEVSGWEPMGAVFNEQARTIDVNEHGCRFDLSRQVRVGDTLAIRVLQGTLPRADRRAALFQIVWAAPSAMGCTVGAMRLQEKSIWPMNFPDPATAPEKYEKH